MDRWVLAVVCTTGLAFALWCSIRWGRLERSDPEPVGTSFGANAGTTLRAAVVTLYAGAVGGILVAGFGGRLFMRLMAATSSDSLRDVLTEAEEPIGRVTFGGSAFLIVFAGLFGGVVCAGVYRLLRTWLPPQPWLAGAVSGLVTLAAIGGISGMLDGGNKDFTLLTPLWFAVALVLAGAVLLGATVSALHARFERSMPSLNGSSPSRLVLYVPILFFLLTVVTVPVIIAIALVGGVAAPAVARFVSAPGTRRWSRVVTPAATAIAAVVVTVASIDVLSVS